MYSASITKEDSIALNKIQTYFLETRKKYYHKKELLKIIINELEKNPEMLKKFEECISQDKKSNTARIALWIDEELKVMLLRLRDKYGISQTKCISCAIQAFDNFYRVSSMNAVLS
jgi:hypothetical protein